jgi:ubiquinone/menaquinone biosynthesis C-methylase UbiE
MSSEHGNSSETGSESTNPGFTDNEGAKMTTEYDAFAGIYDVQMGAFDADLDFYVDLAREVEPPVLELATGTGRVSLPIARAGVPIVGLDSSVEMLSVAREKLEQEPDLSLRLVQADMRDFDLPDSRGTFGLA